MKVLRLLLLEDKIADAELLLHELRRSGFSPQWTRIHDEAAFIAALEDPPELIIADFSLPSFSGLAALELLHKRNLDIPFILVSGMLEDDYVVTAIKSGADDFVRKARISRLGPAVSKALEAKRLRDMYRQAEQEKLAANEQMRHMASMQAMILDSLPAHIAMLDAQGVIVMVNEAWRQFAIANDSQTPNYAIGRNYLEVCRSACGPGSEEAAQVATAIHRALRGELNEFVLEYPCHSPTDQRWFRMTVNPIAGVGAAGAVVMHLDITERFLAQNALVESASQQRSLVQQLDAERHRLLEAQAVAKVGSWETDLTTMQFTWSEEMFRIFETSFEEFTPTQDDILERVHPADRPGLNAAFAASIGKSGTHSVEHRLQLPGGTVKFVEDRWQIITDPDGKPIRAFGTCRDITENRKLQQQLLQSQKLEAIGQLAGGIAHDFNNLLTVMLSYTSILLGNLAPTDPNHGMLSDIADSAKRAANLTRQLLAFSRQQVLHPQVLDVNASLLELEKMLTRLIGENILVTMDLSPKPHCIHIDVGQFEQIIINLAVNARDAMPAGGRLRIETRLVELDRAAAGKLSGKPGKYVCVSVADDGCGMTPEVLQRLYEPFFTTKPPGKGTGLGLSTVFGIVKQSEGIIDLDSVEGQGTCFRILLPAVEAHAKPAVESRPSVDRGSETILLVEDEPIVARTTRYILESQGYKVQVASNGQEAIELMQAMAQAPQLVITDVIMPVMGGGKLIEHLRGDHPQLKALFVSGYTDDAVLEHGVCAAGDAFLQKPFTPAILAGKVREILDAPT